MRIIKFSAFVYFLPRAFALTSETKYNSLNKTKKKKGEEKEKEKEKKKKKIPVKKKKKIIL